MFTNVESYRWRRDWVLRNQYRHLWDYHVPEMEEKNLQNLSPIFSAALYMESTYLEGFEESHIRRFCAEVNIQVDEAVRTTFDSYIAAIGEPNWDEKYKNILATNIKPRTWQQSASLCYILFFTIHSLPEQDPKQEYLTHTLWALDFDTKETLKRKSPDDVEIFCKMLSGLEVISNAIPDIAYADPVAAVDRAESIENIGRPGGSLKNSRIYPTLRREQKAAVPDGDNPYFLCALSLKVFSNSITVEHIEPWSDSQKMLNFLGNNFCKFSTCIILKKTLRIVKRVEIPWDTSQDRLILTRTTKGCSSCIFKESGNFMLAEESANRARGNIPLIEHFRKQPLGKLLADKPLLRKECFSKVRLSRNGEYVDIHIAEYYREWLNSNSVFYSILRTNPTLAAAAPQEYRDPDILYKFADILSALRKGDLGKRDCTFELAEYDTENPYPGVTYVVTTDSFEYKNFQKQYISTQYDCNIWRKICELAQNIQRGAATIKPSRGDSEFV